jgi:glucose/arabinose dehydrogenase
MNRRSLIILVLVVLVVGGLVALYFGRSLLRRLPINFSDYEFVTVAEGFESPIYVTDAGDGSGRLFVVEQAGVIRIVQDGTTLETPFLDIRSIVNRGGSEQGLLGLVFHPDYATNGQFFINYTALDEKNTIARYQVNPDDPNTADPDSETILLALEDIYANHNGGQLAFGPDGYLYIGTGDGGSAGDPHGNGQNGLALFGKMLRIDVNTTTDDKPYGIPADNPFVDNPDFAPEVWAYGLRNPWRFSFDALTGDLYIADVGQNEWEEINFQPADSTGGENYGWNIMEGTHSYSGEPIPEGLTMPFTEYSHDNGCSVTGGYVYRGSTLPDLHGVYFFGDFCTGIVWTSQRNEDGVWETNRLMNTGFPISSFGTDAAGELYIINYGGSILRLERAT